MLDLIASYLVKGVNIVFNFLPIGFILWLGRRVGGFVYLASGKRARIAYANLKASFCREKTPQELKVLRKKIYTNIAQTFAELIATTKFDQKYIDKYVKVINLDIAAEGSKNPNGMIFLSAHFGNWEMSTVASVYNGFPIHILVRDQKMQRLNELINQLRESRGNIVVRKGFDIKKIFKILREGKTLAIMGDQNAGVNGELVEFFGRPASVAKGPFKFARKSGATIVVALMHRVKGPYHELFLQGPMNIKKDEDIRPYMEEFNRMLEAEVRKYPDQWLWMHKRWKATPVRKIMVLDDGKKGHLNQSLAVCGQIKRYRQSEGFAPEDTQFETVKVSFKSSFTRTVFGLLCPLAGRRAQGSLRLLKWALEDECYNKAVMNYADVIVSCGSSAGGVSKMLKIENNARNVAVMDPGRMLAGWFDVVIVPRHDHDGRKHKDGKYVITELAPNLIMPDELAVYSREKEGPCLGLLFGGDNKYFSLGEGVASRVAESLRAAADGCGGRVYATTSRRTSNEAEEALSKVFSKSGCRADLVSGKNDNDEDTVKKILSASDVVIVSGESISMVSEAVSSEKPVLVFMPEKISAARTKYEKFLKGLEAGQYIRVIKPEDIAFHAEGLIGKKGAARPIEDNDRILGAMYRLF